MPDIKASPWILRSLPRDNKEHRYNNKFALIAAIRCVLNGIKNMESLVAGLCGKNLALLEQAVAEQENLQIAPKIHLKALEARCGHLGYVFSPTEAARLLNNSLLSPVITVDGALFIYPPNQNKQNNLRALCQDLNRKDWGIGPPGTQKEDLWYGDANNPPLDECNPENVKKIQIQLGLNEPEFDRFVSIYTQGFIRPQDLPMALVRAVSTREELNYQIGLDTQRSVTRLCPKTTNQPLSLEGDCHWYMYETQDSSKQQLIFGTIVSRMIFNPDANRSKNGIEVKRLSCDYLYAKYRLQKKLDSSHFHHALTWIREKSINEGQFTILSDEDRRKILWLAISMDAVGVLTQKILTKKRYRHYIEQCSAQELVSLRMDMQDYEKAATSCAKGYGQQADKELKLPDTDPQKNPTNTTGMSIAHYITIGIAKRLRENLAHFAPLQALVPRKIRTLEQLQQVHAANSGDNLFQGDRALSTGALSPEQQALLAGEEICKACYCEQSSQASISKIVLSFVMNVTEAQLAALTPEERTEIATVLKKNPQIKQLLLAVQAWRNTLATTWETDLRYPFNQSLDRLGILEKQIDDALEKLEQITYAVGIQSAFTSPSPKTTTLTPCCCLELLQGHSKLNHALILSARNLQDVSEYLCALEQLTLEREKTQQAYRQRTGFFRWPSTKKERRTFKQQLKQQDAELVRYGVSSLVTPTVITGWKKIFSAPKAFDTFKRSLFSYSIAKKLLNRAKKEPWAWLPAWFLGASKAKARKQAERAVKFQKKALKAYGLDDRMIKNTHAWQLIDIDPHTRIGTPARTSTSAAMITDDFSQQKKPRQLPPSPKNRQPPPNLSRGSIIPASSNQLGAGITDTPAPTRIERSNTPPLPPHVSSVAMCCYTPMNTSSRTSSPQTPSSGNAKKNANITSQTSLAQRYTLFASGSPIHMPDNGDLGASSPLPPSPAKYLGKLHEERFPKDKWDVINGLDLSLPASPAV